MLVFRISLANRLSRAIGGPDSVGWLGENYDGTGIRVWAALSITSDREGCSCFDTHTHTHTHTHSLVLISRRSHVSPMIRVTRMTQRCMFSGVAVQNIVCSTGPSPLGANPAGNEHSSCVIFVTDTDGGHFPPKLRSRHYVFFLFIEKHIKVGPCNN